MTSDSDTNYFSVTVQNTKVLPVIKETGDYILFLQCTIGVGFVPNIFAAFGANVALGPTIFSGNTSSTLFYTNTTSFYVHIYSVRCSTAGTGAANTITFTQAGGAATGGDSDLHCWRVGTVAPLLSPLEEKEPSGPVKYFSVGPGGKLVESTLPPLLLTAEEDDFKGAGEFHVL
jgi:hypothetical protein